MKTILNVAAITLALFFVAGCSRKQNVATVKASEISVTAIATGAKTKSGKPVDAYEVQLAQIPSVILVLGGGKLETSTSALLTLDGQMLAVDRQTMNNTVLILDKQRPGFTPIPDVTPAEARSKCTANSVIDLPVDETLSTLPAPPPGAGN
jgi:hypothetical protein